MYRIKNVNFLGNKLKYREKLNVKIFLTNCGSRELILILIFKSTIGLPWWRSG